MPTKNFQFTCLSTPTEQGFDILAINKGEAKGHGISFTAEVLKESIPLWDELPCFLDHPGFFEGQSVRDLAGACHNPTWNEKENGITLSLIPNGPAAADLTALRDAAKSDAAIAKAIGFSAVLRLTYKSTGEVTKIVTVKSVDCVIDPARGGKFLSAHYSQQGGTMRKTKKPAAPVIEDDEELETIETAASDEENLAAIETLNDGQSRVAQLQANADQSNAVLLGMCANLLTTGLATSKLPAPVQERIRKDFEGKIFEPKDLQARIDADRAMLTELSASAVVQGPARVSGMYNTDDQIRAAVSDMFGVPRDEGLEKVKAARLSGIRELYFMLTGDRMLHGGYYPDEIMLATTTDFTGLVKNALNKIVDQQWAELGRAGYNWWEKIVKVEHFESLNDITGVLVGTVGILPTVAEQGEYTELPIGDSPETASFVKKGGYIPLTLELIDRDNTRKLKAYPVELANSALRTLSSRVAEIFTYNNSVGPAMADGGDLFNATAVTTAGGHKNLLTTALGTDLTAWRAVQKAMYAQPLLIKNDAANRGTGPAMAIKPKYCLVPIDLEGAANDLFLKNWTASGDNLIKGQVEPIVVPEWTDATDWAAVADPKIAPAIIVGERFGMKPEIFIAGRETDPAVFMNDEHRIKVRDFKAILVQDFRPLHKSNVAD